MALKTSQLCFVTSYYPIREEEHGRNRLDYYRHLKDLCQLIKNVAIYIYLDEGVDFNFDDEENVYIIKYKFCEIPTHELFFSMPEKTFSPKNQQIELRDPRYLTIQYGKFFFLKNTLENYDNFKYAMWIDAGSTRFISSINPNIYEYLERLSEVDIHLQVNLLPYPLHYARSFHNRIKRGQSAVCGSFFAVSEKAANKLYLDSAQYLSLARQKKIGLHNEQIYLSSLVGSRKFNLSCYLRIFDKNHLACLPANHTKMIFNLYIQGYIIKGMTLKNPSIHGLITLSLIAHLISRLNKIFKIFKQLFCQN